MLKSSNHLLSEALNGSYYEYIIDHLQESLIVIDGNFEIADANEVFIKQYNASSPIGMKCYEVTHGSDKPCSDYGVRCPVKEVMENKTRIEVLHEHKVTGRTVWENIVAFPLASKDGKVDYVVETLRDVSDLHNTKEHLKHTLTGIIHILATTIEKRDPYTAGHQRRVAKLSIAISRELGFQKNGEDVLSLAAQIHDIGKISIPAEILSKPAKLTAEEFALIKSHSRIGHEILNGFDFGDPIAEIILQHHENIDGSGYPQGITGENILVEAKIIRVADTVEAMASHRPYRAELGIDAALEEINAKKGVFYDPVVVDACTSVFKKKEFKFA